MGCVAHVGVMCSIREVFYSRNTGTKKQKVGYVHPRWKKVGAGNGTSSYLPPGCCPAHCIGMMCWPTTPDDASPSDTTASIHCTGQLCLSNPGTEPTGVIKPRSSWPA